MITAKKLSVYKSHNGNRAAWSQSANVAMKRFMPDGDWTLIDKLIRDIQIATQEELSTPQMVELEKKLKNNCEDSRTIQLLRQLAEEMR